MSPLAGLPLAAPSNLKYNVRDPPQHTNLKKWVQSHTICGLTIQSLWFDDLFVNQSIGLKQLRQQVTDPELDWESK